MFGVLPIDKPPGLTSRDVVNRVQSLIRPIKIGHTGTLDPMATGVLLLVVGQATKLVEFAHTLTKCYDADFELGKCSDTLDITGSVEQLNPPDSITSVAIMEQLAAFRGCIEQVPPQYSAVHVSGKRAYELARQGQPVDIPSRQVWIHRLDLLGHSNLHFSLRIECSSGTYIRSLGSDIAQALGSNAVMTRLVRTAIGSLTLADCVPLDQLCDRTAVAASLKPPQLLVEKMPHVTLGADDVSHLRHGRPFELDAGHGQYGEQPICAVDHGNNLVGILIQSTTGRFRSLRVFHNPSDTSHPPAKRRPQRPES